MPSCFNPVTTRRDNESIVHLQSLHGGATDGCYPNDVHSILTPAEVLAPALLTGMKEWYLALGFRINAMDVSPFVAIAPGACQAEIAFVCGAALGQRNDMFDVHLGTANFLSCLTISAAMMKRSSNVITQSACDGVHAHTLELVEERCAPTQTEQSIGTRFQERHTAIFLP